MRSSNDMWVSRDSGSGRGAREVRCAIMGSRGDRCQGTNRCKRLTHKPLTAHASERPSLTAKLRLILNFGPFGVPRVIRLFVVALTVLCSSAASASDSQLPFTGRVNDQAGAALPGATVTAVPEPPGPTLTTVTDHAGEFHFAL